MGSKALIFFKDKFYIGGSIVEKYIPVFMRFDGYDEHVLNVFKTMYCLYMIDDKYTWKIGDSVLESGWYNAMYFIIIDTLMREAGSCDLKPYAPTPCSFIDDTLFIREVELLNKLGKAIEEALVKKVTHIDVPVEKIVKLFDNEIYKLYYLEVKGGKWILHRLTSNLGTNNLVIVYLRNWEICEKCCNVLSEEKCKELVEPWRKSLRQYLESIISKT